MSEETKKTSQTVEENEKSLKTIVEGTLSTSSVNVAANSITLSANTINLV